MGETSDHFAPHDEFNGSFRGGLPTGGTWSSSGDTHYVHHTTDEERARASVYPKSRRRMWRQINRLLRRSP